MKNLFLASLSSFLFACQAASPAFELRGGTLFAGATISGSGSGGEWTMRADGGDVLLRIGGSTARLVDAMPDGGLRYAEEAPPQPHFVLELPNGLHARWRGTSLSVGAHVHRLDAAGEYVIDANGDLVRGPR